MKILLHIHTPPCPRSSQKRFLETLLRERKRREEGNEKKKMNLMRKMVLQEGRGDH